MEYVYSYSVSKLIKNGGFDKLKSIIENEFASCTNECNKLIVKFSSTKHNFIVPSPWEPKTYYLFLGIETPFLTNENPLLFRGIVMHERGHIPFISRDPQPAPSLILRLKEIFGIVPDLTMEHVNHFLGKLVFQNTLIDIGIISSKDTNLVDAYIEQYLQEHIEDIETNASADSPDFPKVCASVMQRAAVAKCCTRKPWYTFGTDERLNKIKRMTYDFRDEKLRLETEKRSFDKGLKILSNSKHEYNWPLFNSVFSDIVSV